MSASTVRATERGTLLLVVVFIATAVAALAAITSGRVVTETRAQRSMESETRAYNDAYAQIHMSMNVVNNSAYDQLNHNLSIRASMTGEFGGTASEEMVNSDPFQSESTGAENGKGAPPETNGTGGKGTTTGTYSVESWRDDPEGVVHGMIEGTEVRVYHARDYIKRLAQLRGEEPEDVDPFGDSDKYFALEAAGRSGGLVRIVSALVRESEPFSSFVFFQNRHTLGVSGTPRGLIHTNQDLSFYFPGGRYVDGLSSVGGFDYTAGATPENTRIMDGNPSATEITLEEVNFDELKAKSNYVGEAGLDAEILFSKNGSVRIIPYTKPRLDIVEFDRWQSELQGYETETFTATRTVQTGTTTEERTRQVQTGTTTEFYTVTVPVYEWVDETYTVTTPIYEDVEVEKTREVPIYDTRTVTKTRWVQVFVPYTTGSDGSGGTAVGGSGVLGEYQWVQEEYEATETYVSGYETETYTVTEQVQVGETTEELTRSVRNQIGTIEEERSREVAVYTEETYTVEVPVYETEEYEDTREVPIYEDVRYVEEKLQYQPPVPQGSDLVWLNDQSGMIYIDGRIISVEGELDGRLTLVGEEKVRITGDITYVDADGDTAMLNGNSESEAYTRNPDYNGDATLGIIARDDVVFTWNMADHAEINGTLMSVEGRVGTDGVWIDEQGEVHRDSSRTRKKLLTPAEVTLEDMYDQSGTWRTRRFVKESLRRMGGIISNDRIVETYIRPRKDGTAYVANGFKRGTMRFDVNLLFNPPPNFVEIPRPVLSYVAPVFLVRNNDD